MEIIFFETSTIDLNKISNSKLQEGYIVSLTEYIGNLKEMPHLGKQIYKSKYHNIRQLIFRKHKIIYQIKNNKIYIHMIVHNSKNIEDFLNQLFFILF